MHLFIMGVDNELRSTRINIDSFTIDIRRNQLIALSCDNDGLIVNDVSKLF